MYIILFLTSVFAYLALYAERKEYRELYAFFTFVGVTLLIWGFIS